MKDKLFMRVEEVQEQLCVSRAFAYNIIRDLNVSLLINMGCSAVDIANRVGHESIDITFRYAHMFPNKQSEIANKLNIERSA